MSNIRLNKYLAERGIASRRKADELIASGKVLINGKRVFELGVKVDPSVDKVSIQGQHLETNQQKIYLMFHKPKHVLTTMSDPHGRPCIADFLPHMKSRVFPIGRLDWDSEGLLLLTNDGDFANEISHPRFKVPKTYLVKIDGNISPDQMRKLKNGVSIPDGGRVSALSVHKMQSKAQSDWIKIIIGEGKNRQVRKMLEKVGFSVLKLQRVAIGRLNLGKLERGTYTHLSDVHIRKIFVPWTAPIETPHRPTVKPSARPPHGRRSERSVSRPRPR